MILFFPLAPSYVQKFACPVIIIRMNTTIAVDFYSFYVALKYNLHE